MVANQCFRFGAEPLAILLPFVLPCVSKWFDSFLRGEMPFSLPPTPHERLLNNVDAFFCFSMVVNLPWGVVVNLPWGVLFHPRVVFAYFGIVILCREFGIDDRRLVCFRIVSSQRRGASFVSKTTSIKNLKCIPPCQLPRLLRYGYVPLCIVQLVQP